MTRYWWEQKTVTIKWHEDKEWRDGSAPIKNYDKVRQSKDSYEIRVKHQWVAADRNKIQKISTIRWTAIKSGSRREKPSANNK